MNINRAFITGIGTDVGKTIVSAIVARALEAAYWKPVQAGGLDNSDSREIKRWLGQGQPAVEEVYKLNQSLSPHAAASIDKIEISIAKIEKAYNKIVHKSLVIEGAGGLMVPLNNKELVIDLIATLKIPVILVSQNYLGSINHTLLSIEALKNRNISIAGIIFNGDSTPASEEYILSYSKTPCLLRVPKVNIITPKFIEEQALLFISRKEHKD